MRTFKIVTLMVGLILMVSCSNMNSANQSGNKDTGAWDADSRNNEDATLGAKSINMPPQQVMKTPTQDHTIAHMNADLRMNHELGEKVKQLVKASAAAVAVTTNNVYVAVDLEESKSMKNQSMENIQDPAKGAGIFGSGVGTGLDWSSSKALPKEVSMQIMNEIRRSYPNGNLFISANPNYVNRMVYYDYQQDQGVNVMDYLNEFNTMSQYAFPEYSNGQNRLQP
jgi:hypothetical protein